MVFVKKWLNSSNSATYGSWYTMKSRCYNKKNKDYYNYGGRGITVCERWLSNYDNFFEDMGEKPLSLTLDRINPDGNYEPKNCRWANSSVQANNKTNNVFLIRDGKIQTISEWSKQSGINAHTLAYRINTGKDVNKIFKKEKLQPENYNHLKNLKRKDNVHIEFEGKKLSIAQWAFETGLQESTIWHRLFKHKWTIEKTLTHPTEITWSHGTNTGYSKYKCRCADCKEFNRIKSKKARDKLKIKQYG